MAGKGNIVARVFLARESVPVSNAIVTVTKEEGGNQILLGTRRTDENGKTSPIEVDTPNIEYSLEAENEIKPYLSVDIRVDHPSAYTVIIRNVQVFADNTSIMNVSLIPLREGDKVNEQEVIEISPQNL